MDKKTKEDIVSIIICLSLAILIAAVVLLFFARTVGVSGVSMMNTLYDGDRVVISNFRYQPAVGDIVVIYSDHEDFESKTLIKRIIATEGQLVEIDFESGNVYVDGLLQHEPFVREQRIINCGFGGSLLVEYGHVFLMGDNRNYSIDSRDSRIGQVSNDNIIGRLIFILVPGEDDYGLRDFGRFGRIEDYDG